MAKPYILCISAGILCVSFLILNLMWARVIHDTAAKVFSIIITLTTTIGLTLIVIPKPCFESWYTVFQMSTWAVFLVLWYGCSDKLLIIMYVLVDISGVFALFFFLLDLYRSIQEEPLPV
jgi:hypothetical protein